MSARRRILLYLPFAAQAVFQGFGWRWCGSALTTGLVVLILPGLGWARLFAATGWASTLALALAFSYFTVILGVVGHYVVNVLPGPWSFLAWLWAVAAIGELLVAAKRRSLLPPMSAAAVLGTLAVFGYFSFGAARVVPPQQDQDLVVANPVYGYFRDLKPYGLETHFTYLFSKPSYLHLVAGSAICLWGDLDATKPYYDRARLTQRRSFPRSRIDELRGKDIEQFARDEKLLWSTRTTAVMLASLLPVVLYAVCRRLGVSTRWSALTAVVYVSFPEVFIRSSFAGFTMVGNFFASLVLLLYVTRLKEGRHAAGLFAAAALMAGSNQKTLLLVPALLLHQLLLRIRAAGIRGAWSWLTGLIADPFFCGVLVGWGTFCAYGLWADADTFVRDHLYYDFRDRFLLQDVRFQHLDGWWYPSITEVWLEFSRNLNWIFLPIALLAVLWLAPRMGTHAWVIVPWVLLGAVLGSVTDWRQTKHLMLILPPLVVSWAVALDRVGTTLRVLAWGAALFCIVWGFSATLRLWSDFASLSPSTIW